MRALVTIAVIGLLVAAASAQCIAAPSVDPYAPSNCSVYKSCDTKFCACVSASANTNNATACLASSSVNCTQVQTCLLSYTTCVESIENNRTSSESACNATGSAMHAAMIAAAAGSYSGSLLQQSCRRRVCFVASAKTCSFGTNDSNVCMAPVTSAPTTTAANTLPPSAQFAIRATLKLSGSAYQQLLSNPTARAMLESALQSDLATLLGIAAAYVRILNLTVGSLIVDFAILNGSGKSVSALNTGLQQATANTNWLSSTKTIYRTVSNETISVLSLTVTEAGGSSAAPTTTAPSTTGGGALPSSAAGTSVIAAAAIAVLALML